MILIPLTPKRLGLVAIVDDCDARLAESKWSVRKGRSTFYAIRYESKGSGLKKAIKMHREVLGFPECPAIDHRNGNGLDCRRENLRVATLFDNSRNARMRTDNTSGFKGVYRRNNCTRWAARIRGGAKTIHIGHFATAEDAARAYDDAARRYHGEFAALNFPGPNEMGAKTSRAPRIDHG